MKTKLRTKKILVVLLLGQCSFLILFTTCYLNRRWVLQQLIQETSLPSFMTKGNLGTIPAERTQRLIQEEMEVCGEAAGRYPSNYNAWSHRIWVLQHLAKLDVKVGLLLSLPRHTPHLLFKSSGSSSSPEEL